jgi:hypothetical protein
MYVVNRKNPYHVSNPKKIGCSLVTGVLVYMCTQYPVGNMRGHVVATCVAGEQVCMLFASRPLLLAAGDDKCVWLACCTYILQQGSMPPGA